ncbi:MAG: ZIP family metal transporter [Methylococcus sp.]|nr:ZIP family metal transporter [Methylococcus sp.]
MAAIVFKELGERIKACPLAQRYLALPLLMQRLAAVASGVAALTLILALVYIYISPVIASGILASVLAGLATGAGALPALFVREVSHRTLCIMLGGAAGVMLAATAFSLIVPGIEYGNQVWPGKGIFAVAIGMLTGALFLELADRVLPYERFLAEKGELIGSLKKIWLFIVAITLHNFPEGMAVGVSFGGGDYHDGVALAIAVGLQNIPEGLAVAMPLVGMGYNRRQAVLIATFTGLVEPLGAVMGLGMVAAFFPLLPLGMAFAAGAMLFVISDDIIPETQSRGKMRSATFAVMIGFVVMMILDNLFG